MADFDPWADLYDWLHPGLPGEAEFYVGQAVRLGRPTLELGCGTGRITIPTALSGVDVIGLDDSAAMLDRLDEKLDAIGETPGAIEAVQGDMRDFTLDQRFGLITMPYRGFMHLHTPEDQVRALTCVRAHLEDDGLFVFNTWDARPSHFHKMDGALRLVGRVELPEGEAAALLHYQATRVDELRQALLEEHLVHELDPSGEVLASRSLRLTRTWSTRRQLTHLLARCGFEVEALLGDFDATPPDTTSTEMIWLLRRG